MNPRTKLTFDGAAATASARIIDLRSDFVARPTPAMVEAMCRAAEQPCGFELREDPIVSRLEKRAAEIIGKEDALFVPTCTMANQIALHVHCRPGELFVTETDAHVITSESAATAALTGAMPKLVAADAGALDLDTLRGVLAHSDPQRARPAVVVQENTHVRSGGRVVPLKHLRAVSEIARNHGVPVHLDGARIFNAATAVTIDSRDFAESCDTIAFNLNKGLGAPLGAILAGSEKVITEAVRIRQMFGGGWRPAGILAAAGLVALDTMIERLHDDHRHARQLATGLASIAGLHIDVDHVLTNIVLARPATMTPEALAANLLDHGIRVLPFGYNVRLVTHHEITPQSVRATLAAFHAVFNGEQNGS